MEKNQILGLLASLIVVVLFIAYVVGSETDIKHLKKNYKYIKTLNRCIKTITHLVKVSCPNVERCTNVKNGSLYQSGLRS